MVEEKCGEVAPTEAEAPVKAKGESDTTTTFPVGSRTTVQGTTQEVLTSGFGMGPGISPPLWSCTLSNRIGKFTVRQRPTQVCGRERIDAEH